jgi:hypothetical protein
MERFLGRAHRWLGIATIAVFLVTGVVLRRNHLNLLALDSGLRLLFRSRHVYLLFSGLLNLAIGLRFALPPAARGAVVALVGSILILTSPFFLAAAFVLEPMTSGTVGPVSTLGVAAAFSGVLGYSLGIWSLRSRTGV